MFLHIWHKKNAIIYTEKIQLLLHCEYELLSVMIFLVWWMLSTNLGCTSGALPFGPWVGFVMPASLGQYVNVIMHVRFSNIALLCPINFDMLFQFLFVTRYFFIYLLAELMMLQWTEPPGQGSIFLLTCFLTHWLFRNVLFNIHTFVNVPVFLLLLISSFMLLWLEKIPNMISVFSNFWDFICTLIFHLSWRVFLLLKKTVCFGTAE